LFSGNQNMQAAASLLGRLMPATYYFHDFWNFEGREQQIQMIQFMKNLSLMGTMLFLMANGAGAMSLDARPAARASS
jgi:putative oxidoreductase